MASTVHIIGAGLAGLACAVRLAGRGVSTVVHEATDQAGGRCRSYHDATTGMRIDNGTHILLSGNTAALAFLADIGASGLVTGAPAARYPFVDLATGERWTLDLGAGRLSPWMFDRGRRAPGTRAIDYLPLVRILWPSPGKTLGEIMACAGPAYERVVKPFLLAALNIDPREGSSDLARAVVVETIAAGGQACRPYLAPQGLSVAFVEPALAFLRGHGGTVLFSHQLRKLVAADGRVCGLDFGDSTTAIGPNDAVVLTVPPYAASTIVPGLTVPVEYRAIINAHFRLSPPDIAPMIGVVNGVAEWIFAFEDRISVTISDAGRFLELPRDQVAQMIWQDVQRVAGISTALPPWQLVRERRATFAATPAQNARRPGAATAWRNLVLAGDWTATGLPATIESAVRSGNRAADLVLQARPVH
jgi:squalene-associated FAD-dependent desaturase